jgi:hypothetical protein
MIGSSPARFHASDEAIAYTPGMEVAAPPNSDFGDVRINQASRASIVVRFAPKADKQ